MFFGGLARMSSQRNLRCFPAHLMCVAYLLNCYFYGLWLWDLIKGLVFDQCKGQTQ